MSDTPQGPGWWRASDGKYYPPEQRPATPATPSMPPPGGAGSGGPGGGSGSVIPPGLDAQGFLRSLYDFKFDHYVTPRLLRFFYAVFVVALSIGAVILLLSALASGESGAVVVGLILVPVGYLVYLIGLRIYFELVSALFRISDDLHAIRRSKGL